MTIADGGNPVLSESHQSCASSKSTPVLLQIQPRNGNSTVVSSLAALPPKTTSQPRPAYLYYPRPDDASGNTVPVPLVRQLNWSFYTDCQHQEDYPESSGSGSGSVASRRLLPQTEEALRLLREIDSNIAAVGPGEFGSGNGFRTLVSNDNCGRGHHQYQQQQKVVDGDDEAGDCDEMSYYLSNGPRSLFFNSSLSPPRNDDSGGKSDTEPLQPAGATTSGNAASTTADPVAASTSTTLPTTVPKPTASSSSVYDFGRMFKRPTYSSGILNSTPSASGALASGLANSKPIVSSSSLYPAQPPRIIGSTSANFGAGAGAGSSPRPAVEPVEPVQNLKIAFRDSPSSSTVTTTPTSTAPGSVTHHQGTAPEVPGMMVHRNGPAGTSGSGGGGSAVQTTNQVTSSVGNNCNSDPSASANRGVQNQHHQNQMVVTGRNGDGGVGNPGVQLTLYGWRKKCLYTVILLLMVMIIINLALTLWILKVMEFSADGMGQLKIVSGGVELRGQALVLDMLRASSIRSRHGTPISIESSRNFSVNTRDAEGFIENQLFLGHDRFEVLANHFRVGDTHGTPLFAVDRDEVTIGASSLRVEGEGGVIFKDSIQTPLVRAEAGKDLKLESPTRSLEARATQEIFIQSRAGSIEANCLNDLKLHSVAGSIRLDASTILFPNLKTVQAGSGSGDRREHVTASSASSASSHSKIYQLCACSNGKLFLAPAHSICATDDSAICR